MEAGFPWVLQIIGEIINRLPWNPEVVGSIEGLVMLSINHAKPQI